MPEISIVVAYNNERVIGANNQLPWHIPEDLNHFKALTVGKPIIMGRKTFESIGRVLPRRTNIVISQSGFNYPGVIVFPSLQAAVAAYSGEPEIAIIGGGQLFQEALPLATKLHITQVDVAVANPCAWFPEINFNEWQLVHKRELISETGIHCLFCDYQRRNHE